MDNVSHKNLILSESELPTLTDKELRESKEINQIIDMAVALIPDKKKSIRMIYCYEDLPLMKGTCYGVRIWFSAEYCKEIHEMIFPNFYVDFPKIYNPYFIKYSYMRRELAARLEIRFNPCIKSSGRKRLY